MNIELIASDLRVIMQMMPVLTQAASIDHIGEVAIRFRCEGGDWITLGYGQQGEPAVLAIEPAEGSEHEK